MIKDADSDYKYFRNYDFVNRGYNVCKCSLQRTFKEPFYFTSLFKSGGHYKFGPGFPETFPQLDLAFNPAISGMTLGFGSAFNRNPFFSIYFNSHHSDINVTEFFSQWFRNFDSNSMDSFKNDFDDEIKKRAGQNSSIHKNDYKLQSKSIDNGTVEILNDRNIKPDEANRVTRIRNPDLKGIADRPAEENHMLMREERATGPESGNRQVERPGNSGSFYNFRNRETISNKRLNYSNSVQSIDRQEILNNLREERTSLVRSQQKRRFLRTLESFKRNSRSINSSAYKSRNISIYRDRFSQSEFIRSRSSRTGNSSVEKRESASTRSVGSKSSRSSGGKKQTHGKNN